MPAPADLASIDWLAVRRHPLVAETARRLRGRCGLRDGAAVVVAASGGGDSTALVLAVAALAARSSPSVRPVVAHVHHHLRDGADDDAGFVEALAARLGLPFRVEHLDVTAGAGNLAARARAARYAALARIAVTDAADAVLCAHHAEDQLETMLMAIARGAGVQGVAGMRWSRPSDDGPPLLRPFLATPRARLLDLCARAGVSWREDPTNGDLDRRRARLRADVLPVLESLWPGAAARAAALADRLAELDDDSPRVALEAAFGPASARRWPRETLRALSATMIAAGLRRAVLAGAPDLADRVRRRVLIDVAEAIRDDTRRPRTFTLPAGWTIRVTSLDVVLDPAGDDRCAVR